MVTRLNPHLSFRDTARGAMEFYRSILGGTLTISTFAECQASDDPAEADKVMHAHLETADGLILMAADTPNAMEVTAGSAISLSLSGDDETRLRDAWQGLSEGGTVVMPMERVPWGASFGMVVDRYGITWMVNITD